jgi:hypothetical protein
LNAFCRAYKRGLVIKERQSTVLPKLREECPMPTWTKHG